MDPEKQELVRPDFPPQVIHKVDVKLVLGL